MYFINNIIGFYYFNYWASLIRITFREYTYFINGFEDNGKVIFLSDFIYFYYCKDYIIKDIKDSDNYNPNNNIKNSYFDEYNNTRIHYYYQLINNYLNFRIYISCIKAVGKNFTEEFRE